MTIKSNHILEITNLNVEFPIFGGIFQHEVSSIHAVKNFNLIIFSLNNHSGQNLTQIHPIHELWTVHFVSDVCTKFRLTSAK